MAVAYGSQGTYLLYGSHTETDLLPPPDIVDGDLLIAYVAVAGATEPDTPVPPDGWNLIPNSPTVVSLEGFFVKYCIFYKIASGESGDYIFTQTATLNSCGVVIRYTGVDPVTPFAPTPTANTGTGVLATATGFTLTQPNTFVIFTEHDWADTTTPTTPPFGTMRIDDILVFISDGTIAPTGPTGDQSHLCNSNTGDPWAAYLIGLNSSGGPAPSGRSFGTIIG